MPTTRSAAKSKQISLKDLKEADEIVAKPVTERKGKKRALAGPSDRTRPAKKSKHGSDETADDHHDVKGHEQGQEDSGGLEEKPIMINRSPVLQLWAACVANFLHPELSFDTCLSIGSTISSLCAVSKGKAIGAIQPKDKSTEERQAQKDRRHAAEEDSKRVEVMHFTLSIKDGVALMDGKKKNASETSLESKFGGHDQYTRVKEVMLKTLDGWKGKEARLNGRAFAMYEGFRPTVPQGQRGWGRKGELDLEKIKGAIEK